LAEISGQTQAAEMPLALPPSLLFQSLTQTLRREREREKLLVPAVGGSEEAGAPKPDAGRRREEMTWDVALDRAGDPSRGLKRSGDHSKLSERGGSQRQERDMVRSSKKSWRSEWTWGSVAVLFLYLIPRIIIIIIILVSTTYGCFYYIWVSSLFN
ncbi:hypothetical protein GW17_00056040, partial [Ensete ventricosum]